MSNAITYAVSRIKASIPPQILSRFFVPTKFGQTRRDPFTPTSIDNLIIDKIINGRVREDCDTAGATEAVIPLIGLPMEMIDQGKFIIHIPKERTNGRIITHALALIYYGLNTTGNSGVLSGAAAINVMGSSLGSAGNGNCGNNQALGMADSMSKSFQPIATTQTTNVRIVDGHTLLIEELYIPSANPHLRCLLANDSEFSTLSRAAYHAFGELCVRAAKAYIYNTYILDIDLAELVGGQELGKFKDIVEGYADAEELYLEYYNDKWRKIQFMNDEYRHARFIKSMMGRLI